MLSSDQIGQRVVIRRRLRSDSDRTPRQATYGDVLGILESWTNHVLAVRRADGALVWIHEDDVVAGKPIPPRPARRRPAGMRPSGEHLAALTAHGWPATESEPLGDWQLRAADGFTGRANSTLVIGSPGVPLDDALARVRDFYAARGLAARLQVVVDSAYEAELQQRGWRAVASPTAKHARNPTALVQVAALDTLAERAGPPGTAVGLTHHLSDEWYARYRGADPGHGPTPAARHVLTAPDLVAFATIDVAAVASPADSPRGAELPVAVGRGVVVEDCLGLAAMVVDPRFRRRGLARAIVASLTRWGRQHDAQWAYVQVEEDNAAARRLYERLGFRTDHAYRYYEPPAPTP